MNNDKSLVIVDSAQSPQVVAVSDVSAAEIEYQKIVQQHKALVREAKKLTKRYDKAFECLARAWFAENHPSVQYHFEYPGPTDDKTAIFGVAVLFDSPGYSKIYQEFVDYLIALEG